MRRLLALGLALAALCVGAPAAAHPITRSFCTATLVAGGVDVAIETPGHLLTRALALDSEAPGKDALEAAQARYLAAVSRALGAETRSGTCALQSAETRVVELDGEPSLEARLAYDCAPGTVTLKNAWRLEVDPASETLCALDGRAFTFHVGATEAELGVAPSLRDALLDLVSSGARHVLGGADHVAFVLLLLLGAAASARAQRIRQGLMRLATIVTGFTLGHSLTLALAALGIWSLPARLSETAIALSVAWVGLENAWSPRLRQRAGVAAAFGLVHGFGFARALDELALPSRAHLLGLLSFNLGVELAQLTLVAPLFPLAALAARRDGFRRWLLVPVSLTLAALGLIWALARALGRELPAWLLGG